jgi:Ca-activated chloride channel family protein
MHKTSIELILALLAVPLVAQQPGTPPRIQTAFDAMMQQGGIFDIHTMEELDRNRHDQLEKRSEATLSRLDLNAPGKARNQFNKGLQFLARNDYQNAIANLSQAVAIYPGFVAAHNALGCAYFNRKQNDQARAEFTRAIELDDHLSFSYVNLGRAELALGQVPAAQAALEKASAIAPLDANLAVVLAYIQFLNHDYPGAIRTAQQAHRRSHPDTALVHYFSAAAWQAQSNLDETQNELLTFLTEDPKSPFAPQAQQIIQQIRSGPATSVAASEGPPVSFDTTTSATASLHGQKVLQDLREKQQVAEAEAEGSNPAATNSGGSPMAEPRSPDLSGGDANRRNSSWTFRSVAEEVVVFFTATDHGKSVTNLARDEVNLLDDQKPPAAVLGFHSESGLPLRLGLLIDTSVSVTDRFSFEQKAATNFLQQVLVGKNDRAFVAGFSNSVVLVQGFTADLNQLSHGIHQLVPVGGTSVWDAVSFAADKLAEAKEAQPVAKVLVVISDGDDNSSSVTLKQAIERAEKDEVIVYTVSTREVDAGNDNDLTGNHAMKVLAELTGGAAFFPGSADHLNHSLAELQQVIRSRYLIAYKPAQFRHDGRYRTVAITAKKSGRKLKVSSRKGYYADAPAPGSARF